MDYHLKQEQQQQQEDEMTKLIFRDFLHQFQTSVLVIPCSDPDLRRRIHFQMEQWGMESKLMSLSVNQNRFPLGERRFRMVMCGRWRCRKWVKMTDYHDGILPSNMDESWTGVCQRCGEFTRFEPNYDSDDDNDCVRVIRKNNVFLFGRCISSSSNQRAKRFHQTNKTAAGGGSIMKEEEWFELIRASLILDIPTFDQKWSLWSFETEMPKWEQSRFRFSFSDVLKRGWQPTMTKKNWKTFLDRHIFSSQQPGSILLVLDQEKQRKQQQDVEKTMDRIHDSIDYHLHSPQSSHPSNTGKKRQTNQENHHDEKLTDLETTIYLDPFILELLSMTTESD